MLGSGLSGLTMKAPVVAEPGVIWFLARTLCLLKDAWAQTGVKLYESAHRIVGIANKAISVRREDVIWLTCMVLTVNVVTVRGNSKQGKFGKNSIALLFI